MMSLQIYEDKAMPYFIATIKVTVAATDEQDAEKKINEWLDREVENDRVSDASLVAGSVQRFE